MYNPPALPLTRTFVAGGNEWRGEFSCRQPAGGATVVAKSEYF